MQVRLEMKGAGWMQLDLAHGPDEVGIFSGYLVDSPGDLLDALVRLLTAAETEARVLFNAEPGEWVLRMRMLPGRLLRVEVHGPGEDGPPPEPLGEPVFRHTEPAERFAARVWHEFHRLLREHGEDGYQRLWGMYPFPRRGYDALEAALRV